jgi:hypothetical protein
MRAPGEIVIAVVWATVWVATIGACTKSAAPTSPSPADHSERGDPLVELERLEREMDRLGLRGSADEASLGEAGGGAGMDRDALDGAEAEEAPAPQAVSEAESSGRWEPSSRCAQLCDLSAAICDLEVQICALAENHRNSPAYAEACRRAGEDCDIADQACDQCRS